MNTRITKIKNGLLACGAFCFALAGSYSDLLAQNNTDIKVTDRAIVQRCITSKSARDIAVGMPGGFNFAFDPVKCRLSYVWFGGFLDFRNESTSRGGRKVGILGAKQDVGTDELPIRISDSDKAPETIKFGGYRKDRTSGIPTFLFSIDGVNIEQRVLSFGPNQVAVELSFPESNNQQRFYRMDKSVIQSVMLSQGLKQNESGVIEIPSTTNWAQIRVQLKPSKQKFVRQEPTTNGKLLYAIHCMSCHTLDGAKKIGPSFAELWTVPRKITRGDSQQDGGHYQDAQRKTNRCTGSIFDGFEKD